MPDKQLLLNLSESEYGMLEKLSSANGLRKAEYLRLVIQTIYIAEETKNANVKENKDGSIEFNIGSYGFQLDKEFIDGYASKLEGFFEGIEKRMKKVVLRRPKTNKKVVIRKIPDSVGKGKKAEK